MDGINKYGSISMNHELINDDCMNVMARYPDKHFDLAIVDPPYRDENQPTKDMRDRGQMETIQGRPKKEYWHELFRVSKNQIVWGANNFQLPQFKGFIVWDKVIPFKFTMSMAEIAAISEGLGTISKICKLRVAGAENKIHPTQKPVALYRWILDRYAKPGDLILDTHAGSFSSAVACKEKGFSGVFVELDKDYFDDGKKRVDKTSRQYEIMETTKAVEQETIELFN